MIYCKNIMNVTLCFFTFPRFWNHFFFLHFRQCHCHNCYNFFFPISAMALPQLVCQFFFSFHFRHSMHTRAAELDTGNSVSPLLKFNIFSLHLFLLLSHTFGWISVTVIPKFNLSPQNPKKVWIVLITQINFRFCNINPKDSNFYY